MKRSRNLVLGTITIFALAMLVPVFTQGAKPGVNHKARQTRPIQLGVSGGNATDLANGFCCSGTLGALVTKGGIQYILSNTHVFAGDFVLGGNGTVSTAGDPIDQPGLVDVQCQNIPTDYVATLSEWAPIPSTDNVDAAIAQVIPLMVDSSGSILEIGTISSSTVGAFIGQAVKKSGRTTGLTSSSINGLNATVTVGYTDECGGNSFNKTYTGQILVKNNGSRFLNSGDSGSLMVENVSTNPRAVGLLFAGSSSIAVANPINDVLARFRVTLVGASTASVTTVGGSSVSQEAIARAIQAQQANARLLSSVPKGVGHAVGVGDAGVVIKVLVEEMTPEALAALPQQIDGFPVVVEAVGRVVAF